MTWDEQSESLGLPSGIEVFAGEDESAPLKAWLARINLNDPAIDVRVVASADDDGRESVSDMVRSQQACLGVNGGYFLENDSQFEHIGLLIADGSFEHSATPGVFVGDARYPVRRSALGLDASDEARIGWVSSRQDSSFWWDAPVDNAPDVPYSGQEDSLGAYWNARDALAAGPMIVVDGAVNIAEEEEVFFHTTIPDVHPRTAAGIDDDGNLLLLVVDGRQGASRGVTLQELAGLMLEFDAEDALNLDGGGSSTFIVRDDLLNRPTGATYQREVVSGIVVACD